MKLKATWKVFAAIRQNSSSMPPCLQEINLREIPKTRAHQKPIYQRVSSFAFNTHQNILNG